MTDNEKLHQIPGLIRELRMNQGDGSDWTEDLFSRAADALEASEKAFGEATGTPTAAEGIADEQEAARLRVALDQVWDVIQRDVRTLSNLDPVEIGAIIARALEPAHRSAVPDLSVCGGQYPLTMIDRPDCILDPGHQGKHRNFNDESWWCAMSGERETLANEYISRRGDSQTRADFLAGWDAALRAAGVGGAR